LTIKSMVAQTVRPNCWVIVNDGSIDQTQQIAEQAERDHPWIKVANRTDRGFRKAGGGVVDAFYEGFAVIRSIPWDYIAKLDGDLSFAASYFEECLRHFAQRNRLGIAGGTICFNDRGIALAESPGDPKFHVRGATKVYRRKCWEEIGGLIRAPGWDTVDEVKANMLGWETCTISSAAAIHHRHTGVAYGLWRDKLKNGAGCYITGYHPLFMFLKCLKRMTE